MTHLIDIIIPTYNRPNFLDTCLESIYNQTFTDYKVTIINDGSFSEYFQDYSVVYQKYSPIIKQVINISNSGCCSIPRAIGIINSHAEFICPTDDDTIYAPDKLETLTSIIKDKHLAYGAREDVIINSPIKIASGYKFIENWNPLNGWGIDNSQIMYRRSVYNKIPIEFPKRGDDWELAKLIYSNFGSFAYTPKLVSYYIWHDQNRSLDNKTKTKETYPGLYIKPENYPNYTFSL